MKEFLLVLFEPIIDPLKIILVTLIGKKKMVNIAVIIITLILPNAILTLISTVVSAFLASLLTNSITSYVFSIATIVSLISMTYSAIWGLKIHPHNQKSIPEIIKKLEKSGGKERKDGK